MDLFQQKKQTLTSKNTVKAQGFICTACSVPGRASACHTPVPEQSCHLVLTGSRDAMEGGQLVHSFDQVPVLRVQHTHPDPSCSKVLVGAWIGMMRWDTEKMTS